MSTKEDPPPFTAYQKRLFVFLSVATFFEGFDSIALTQLLPNLRADFNIDEAGGGWLVAFINVGTILAYLFVRQADRWGRRRVLEITIAGYTIASFLTGLAPNVWAFGLFQLIARVFLIAEWATSMVYAAEEYPASRRGHVIGLISAFAALGSVACAGLVPLFLQHADRLAGGLLRRDPAADHARLRAAQPQGHRALHGDVQGQEEEGLLLPDLQRPAQESGSSRWPRSGPSPTPAPPPR